MLWGIENIFVHGIWVKQPLSMMCVSLYIILIIFHIYVRGFWVLANTKTQKVALIILITFSHLGDENF
jgi:hypothetical protein